jgi:uncharacterized protein YdhG (YjbR/CyaY superfamily)
MATKKPAGIDEYIARFPLPTQTALEQVRAIIKNTAPDAGETISYAIPTFTINKRYLVYFAGYKNHVSLYPAPTGNAAFEKEIKPYRSGKGTVQFQLDKPLPIDLITKIVRFRMKENRKQQKPN